MYYIYLILFSFTFTQLQWYNHPELNWQKIETEHFIICFHDESKRSAQEAALVAESVYDDITELYDFNFSFKTAA